MHVVALGKRSASARRGRACTGRLGRAPLAHCAATAATLAATRKLIKYALRKDWIEPLFKKNIDATTPYSRE